MRFASIAATALLTLGATTARAQQSTYSCLEVPYSSHAFALGGYGAGIAVIDDDVTLAGENPGLLGNEVETQVAVNYMHYLGDSNFTGVHFGMGYGAHSAWARSALPPRSAGRPSR